MTDEPGTASGRGIRRLSLGGRGFFCRDGLLEVWLAMLVDAMTPTEAWQKSLAAEWRSQVTVRFDGVMTSELDRYLKSAEQRRVITALCVQVRNRLAHRQLAPGPLTRRVTKAFRRAPITQSPITQSPIDQSPINQSPPLREGLLRVADSMVWLLETSF